MTNICLLYRTVRSKSSMFSCLLHSFVLFDRWDSVSSACSVRLISVRLVVISDWLAFDNLTIRQMIASLEVGTELRSLSFSPSA